MDSYTKDTHRYAFELVKAARTMPVDMAEKLQHIKQMRFNYQLKALEKESIKGLLKQRFLLRVLFHQMHWQDLSFGIWNSSIGVYPMCGPLHPQFVLVLYNYHRL